MLETFNARIDAANQVMDETGVFACPCVIFPEVSRNEAISALIANALEQLASGIAEIRPDILPVLGEMGAEAAIGHALTVAAAAGYALALDSAPVAESFDPDNVDWDSLPNIEDTEGQA